MTATASPTREALREIGALAPSIIVSQLGLMLMGTVDTWMVGRHGGDAIAAMALANTFSFSLMVLGQGAVLGLDPIVAQAQGAGDTEGRERALARGFGMTALVAAPITLLHLAAAPLMRALGQPASVIPLAADYAASLGTSVWPFLLFVLARQSLQARGVTRPVVALVLAANVVNAALNLILMDGIGAWGGLGPAGSGWATALTRAAMTLTLLAACAPEIQAIGRRRADIVDLPAVADLTRRCLPTGLQIGTEVWAFNLGAVVAGWYGAAWTAAHAVALHLAALSFMVPLSIGAATGTVVARRLGADRPWQPAARAGVALGAAWGGAAAAVFALAGDALLRTFLEPGSDAWTYARALLPLAAAFQVFDGVQVVLFGGLRGAGDTRVPMLANLVGYWILGLPLGVTLTLRGAGPPGVWIGFDVALAVVAGLLSVRLVQVSRLGGFRLRA